MALSQRERYIAIGMGAVLGLLALDRFVYTPWDDSRQELATKIQTARDKYHEDAQLLARNQEAQKTWKTMLDNGLTGDTSAAQEQIVKNIREWSQAAGMVPIAIKPDHATSDNKNYQKVTVRFTATGSTASIGRMLYRTENSKLPLRVSEVQITSRREGTDDLQLMMTVTSLCPVPEKKDNKTIVAEAPSRGGRA